MSLRPGASPAGDMLVRRVLRNRREGVLIALDWVLEPGGGRIPAGWITAGGDYVPAGLAMPQASEPAVRVPVLFSASFSDAPAGADLGEPEEWLVLGSQREEQLLREQPGHCWNRGVSLRTTELAADLVRIGHPWLHFQALERPLPASSRKVGLAGRAGDPVRDRFCHAILHGSWFVEVHIGAEMALAEVAQVESDLARVFPVDSLFVSRVAELHGLQVTVHSPRVGMPRTLCAEGARLPEPLTGRAQWLRWMFRDCA